MSTVAVSVPYWGHTAAVCLLVDGITCLQLPTPLPPTHPPPINSIRDITLKRTTVASIFKLVFLKIQNVPLRTVFANPVTNDGWLY